MFCGRCGTENHEGNTYCVACRADLSNQRSSEPHLSSEEEDKWRQLRREQAAYAEWQETYGCLTKVLCWVVWLPLSIALAAEIIPRRMDFGYKIFLWLCMYGLGGFVILGSFLVISFKSLSVISRFCYVDDFASGKRSILDYEPAPYLTVRRRNSHETGRNESPAKKGSVGAAIVWMCLLSALLFWLPVLGPAIAGLVGGKKAGGLGPALLAVIAPAVIGSSVFVWLISSLTGVPLLGALAGAGVFVVAMAHAGGLLLGATIGGLLA